MFGGVDIRTAFSMQVMSKLQTRLRRLFSRKNLPRSKPARIAIGVLMVAFGLVGFLPVLGFWMVPVGLAILSIDIPVVRKFTHRAGVVLGRWWRKLHPKRAAPRRPQRSDLAGRAHAKAHTPP